MKPQLNWKELENLREIAKHQLGKQEVLDFNSWLKEVSPHLTWDWQHLQYIRRYLYQVEVGNLKRLMIFCPPRHGKSEMVTIHLPAYLLEKDPTNRVAVVAYNQTLAERFSRRTKGIVSKRIMLNQERKAVSEWETTAHGGLRAVGIGGGITGLGFNYFIIDDPIKNRMEANSQVYRDRIWDAFRDDIYTRLEPGAAVILIMTRWHHDDLAGRILKSAKDDGEQWSVISLPALAEQNDVLGRHEGQCLCPARYNEQDLYRIKAVLGGGFDALYQQRPSAETGAIFNKRNFQYYDKLLLPKPEFVAQGWDTAFKSGEENDFTVGTTWHYSMNRYYLVDRWKRQAPLNVVKRAIKEAATKHNPDIILIEDQASGQSIIEDFKRETMLPIVPYKTDRDKISRAHATTPAIDAGQVYLPESGEWVEDFITNLIQFPYGEHDDDVDSMSMVIRFLVNKFAFNSMDQDKIIKEVTQYLRPY